MFRSACYFLLIVFCLIVDTQLIAQRFGGGLTLSASLSQIDGDDVLGFNKFGFQAGVYGQARLSKITNLEIHFSYSQRGSRSTADDFSAVKIDLNYLEVPLLFIVKDWLITEKDKDYYRMHFLGGFSFGRLISSSSLTGIDKDFKTTDISWILGARYFYKSNWGISAKYTRSLTPLHQYSNSGRTIKMISYFISLGLNYSFN